MKSYKHKREMRMSVVLSQSVRKEGEDGESVFY